MTENRRTESKIEILGTTKISQGHRISLIGDVQARFADRGIELEEGDKVVFVDRDGEIVVEPASWLWSR